VAAIGALAAGTPVDPQALYDQTGGNPFYVTALLAAADAGIPRNVQEAVLAPTARLSASGQAVLAAAAVIGLRGEPWLLAAVTGAEFAATEECLRLGMLQTEGEQLAFRHELARQVVLEATSPAQRLVLHRLVLAALATSPETKNDLARLTHHAEAAADHQAVARYAPAAARQAAAANAHREAVAHYRRALHVAGALAPRQRAELLAAYGAECTIVDEQQAASAAWREASQLWQEAGEPVRQSVVLSDLASSLVRLGHERLG
jgi:predicted ATPase